MTLSDAELDINETNTDKDNKTEARVSSDDVDSSEPISRVLENNNNNTRSSEVKDEQQPSFVQFELQNDQFTPQDYEFDDDVKNDDDEIEHSRGKGDTKVVAVYNSLLSEFDDFVANERHGAMEGTSRALSYGFEVGDMVWGKVKSHPWWPGHIFNEAFASTSVRRTRREGYVLVAFFGDSSYGWFDPAELIPFDANFAEKSQQTNSRTFVKAVEEAVDEASRRCGLGLACRCRNKFNFRPTNVEGYFEVDVSDYEARGVYSENQIKKAQKRFHPGETLAFIKQLASSPEECDRGTIDFLKNKSTVSALRRAVFEEFDETYAQAFGVQSKRSSNDSVNASNQPVKIPARAPLSGPLVIAEALGGGKSSKKAVKVKDQTKKDRYLIKRRDEQVDSRTIQIGQTQASSLASAAYEEASSVATGDYVLQKRAPTPVSAKNEESGSISNEVGGPSQDSVGKAVILDQDSFLDANLSHNVEKDALQEAKNKMASDTILDPSTSHSDISLKRIPLDVTEAASPSVQQEGEAMVAVKHEESAKVSRLNEGSLLAESVSARTEGDTSFDKTQDTRAGLHILPPKRSIEKSADVGVKKKAKVLKRPLGDLSSDDSFIKGKKKKKKKDSSSETSPDRPKKKRSITGTGGALVGKSTLVSVAPREDPLVHHQKKDVATSNASFSGVGTLPMVSVGNIELDVLHLLSEVHSLAVDPFHGSERSSPSTAVQFILLFRSNFYQKAVPVSPPPETEPVEISAAMSPPSIGVSDHSAGENIRDLPPSKPVKSILRPDDPTKGGRKRLPSDRQEEIAARRLKKITQLKSLAAEKKGGQRSLESHRTEGKELGTTAPTKPVKSDTVRKVEPQPRAVQPTMLVMKFPPETSLPSANRLKAMFARFGSIDQSAIRVFWQSSTCRVVFHHKLDAQAAYKHAVGNSSLFKDVSVRYSLREVGGPASEAPDSDRGRGDDTSLDVPRIKDPAIERPSLAHQPGHQTSVQLKSILKKPTGDEAGQATGGNGGNGGRGTARVKFMLGGEQSTTTSRGEQLMVGNRNFNNNVSFADGGAPTSVAMDFNSKNFQKVIPPSASPILNFPTQFAKPPLNNLHHTEVPTRNMRNLNPPIPPPSAPNIDISQQMLSLLTRCNDVVSTVTGLLGYVPYHPL